MAKPRSNNAESLTRYPVLIVDDEPLNLEAFTFNFGREFSVVTANDAAEARQKLAEHNIAVVVADHRMPGESGLDFLSWVAETHPNVVRILLTAFYEVDLLQDALNRGILFRFAKKPWRFANLRQDVLLAINQRRQLLEKEGAARAAIRENLLRGVGLASRYTLESLVPQVERLDGVMRRAKKKKKGELGELLEDMELILEDLRDELARVKAAMEPLASPQAVVDLRRVGEELAESLRAESLARGVPVRAAEGEPVWATLADPRALETGLRTVVDGWFDQIGVARGHSLVVSVGTTDEGSVEIVLEEEVERGPRETNGVALGAPEALLTRELRALFFTLQGLVETRQGEAAPRLAVVLPAAVAPG